MMRNAFCLYGTQMDGSDRASRESGMRSPTLFEEKAVEMKYRRQ
jgi:hypothetical protein